MKFVTVVHVKGPLASKPALFVTDSLFFTGCSVKVRWMKVWFLEFLEPFLKQIKQILFIFFVCFFFYLLLCLHIKIKTNQARMYFFGSPEPYPQINYSEQRVPGVRLSFTFSTSSRTFWPILTKLYNITCTSTCTCISSLDRKASFFFLCIKGDTCTSTGNQEKKWQVFRYYTWTNMLYVNFFKKSTCEEFHLKRTLTWISQKEFLWLRILYTIYDLEIPSTNIAQEKISYETMSNKFDRKYIRMLFSPLIYVDWSKNQKIGCVMKHSIHWLKTSDATLAEWNIFWTTKLTVM